MSKIEDYLCSKSEIPLKVLPQGKTNSKIHEKVCRICMECEFESTMISPCRCIGSVKFVHESCLKSWIISQGGDPFEKKCELCNAHFQMGIKYNKKCNIFSIKKSIIRFLYIPILMIASICFIVILYLVCSNSIKFQGNNKLEYKIAVIIFCGIFSFLSMMLFVNIIKEVCLEIRLTDWIIKSGVYDDHQESNGELSEKTLVNEVQLSHVFSIESIDKLVDGGMGMKINDLHGCNSAIIHKKSYSGENLARVDISQHNYSISLPNTRS